ncbi:MAG TPA: DinB family protein [Thermoanaerobaculia bacterium]|nr:DinB family protein [Thermoanaerobaculia bacterium]
MPAASTLFITPDALLAQWQGHRRLTRRVIDAFPEEQLFTFSVGGMRTFGELAMEIVTMGVPMVRGAGSGDWSMSSSREPRPKQELLRLWDESTEQLDALWPQIPPERFQETMTAFGQYTDVLHNLILYVIDNEIHHRGQGYVYLRALGIAPPPFYDRS